MTEAPSDLMADASFMSSLSEGDAAATSRWYAAHQAMYPEEGVHHPAGGPPSSSPSTRPSGSPDVAKSAIKAMMADAEAMKRVNSGDEAALKRWNDLHKTAYAEPDQSRGNVPPDGSWYTLPPAPSGFEHVPELEAGFRSAAHAFGLDFGAATELTAAYYKVAEMTQHMTAEDVAAMMRDGIAQLRREPGVLDRARRVYAKLQRTHPAVAAAIEVSGAAANADFVRLLARHVRA